RIGVVVTTKSPVADLRLDSGTIINASVLPDSGGVQVRVERNHLWFTHSSGDSTEAHVRVLVSGIDAGERVQWHLTLSPPAAPTEIEIYNENNQDRVRLVDRFDAYAEESIFESPANLLLAGGSVRISVGPSRLVLAFFYPWYQHFNWSSDRLQDRPLDQYSTDIADEVGRSLEEARRAGLDGVIVSWTGDTDWND